MSPTSCQLLYLALNWLPPEQTENKNVVSNGGTNNSPVETKSTDTVETDNQPDNSSDDKSDPSDLAAQEGMWGAALALVALTFGQIFLGLLTLGLVYNTFRVQKGELEEAILANRAFINYNDFTHKYVSNGDAVHLWLNFHNFGATPATDLVYATGHELFGFSSDPEKPVEIDGSNLFREGAGAILGPGQIITVVMLVEHPTIQVSLYGGAISILVAIRMSYKTIRGKKMTGEYKLRITFDRLDLPLNIPANISHDDRKELIARSTKLKAQHADFKIIDVGKA